MKSVAVALVTALVLILVAITGSANAGYPHETTTTRHTYPTSTTHPSYTTTTAANTTTTCADCTPGTVIFTTTTTVPVETTTTIVTTTPQTVATTTTTEVATSTTTTIQPTTTSSLVETTTTTSLPQSTTSSTTTSITTSTSSTLPPTTSSTTTSTSTTLPDTFTFGAALTVCVQEVPTIRIEFQNQFPSLAGQTGTLIMRDINGNVVSTQSLVYEPGTTVDILYPGTSVNADGSIDDVPGWILTDDGFWIRDPSDDFLRDGINLEYTVNPTATAFVTYPPESSACANPNGPFPPPRLTPGELPPTL